MSELEERFQWVDPETNEIYWLTQEELDDKNG